MLEDRNIKYPSYVLAALLGFVAFTDASNAFRLMQTPNASGGWVVDLLTSGICAAIAILMLMRPHLWFFASAAVWSLVAFLANFVMKAKDGDPTAITRLTFYFVILVGAGVLVAIEGWKFYQVEKAKRPVNPWAGYQGQFPPGYPMPPQQYAPPPAPPAAPPAPPAPPAAPAS